MQEQGETLSSAPEEDGAAEMMCDELTSAPTPMKFRKEGRSGEKVFLRFGFKSHYLTLI